MNKNNPSKEKTLEWIKKAENDFRAAEILLSDPDPPTDTICYHCQQSVEKHLKAFLTANEKDFIKTHDLDYLTKLCLKIEKNFENYQADIISLNKYAIESRYPADIPILYSIEEAKQAFETSKEIIRFIKSQLSL